MFPANNAKNLEVKVGVISFSFPASGERIWVYVLAYTMHGDPFAAVDALFSIYENLWLLPHSTFYLYSKSHLGHTQRLNVKGNKVDTYFIGCL